MLTATRPNLTLSVKDVSERLGISVASTRRLLYGGFLPYFRHGKTIRVDPNDLDAFVESRMVAKRAG